MTAAASTCLHQDDSPDRLLRMMLEAFLKSNQTRINDSVLFFHLLYTRFRDVSGVDRTQFNELGLHESVISDGVAMNQLPLELRLMISRVLHVLDSPEVFGFDGLHCDKLLGAIRVATAEAVSMLRDLHISVPAEVSDEVPVALSAWN
jgi:hypothetical protein